MASASSSTLEDKRSIVRRIAIGALEAGAERLLFAPEPFSIVRRAVGRLGPAIEVLDLALQHREGDSTRAAVRMREEGCAVVVVLGGDGTNRAVAKGWPDVPVIPLSTGTNNVFPIWAEPTVAGAVAGFIASGRIGIDEVARPAKRVRIETPAGEDLAVVDAVAVRDRFVGSLELFDPETLHAAVYARAEPDAIGLSSIGGLLQPCRADDDCGLAVRFASPSKAPRRLRAPLAPGVYSEVGVASFDKLSLGDPFEIEGPCLLALDGERQLRLEAGAVARLRVTRDGPRVIDVPAAMSLAAERGLPLAPRD